MDDDLFMAEALREAERCVETGDVPVGAVAVLDGEIVGRGRNRRVAMQDPLLHAEVDALRDAARTLGHWRLDNVVLYVTLEPCVMCAGAILQSRVCEVVFGARDPKAGGARSQYQLLEDPRAPFRVRVREGPGAEASVQLLQRFFATRRSRTSPQEASGGAADDRDDG